MNFINIKILIGIVVAITLVGGGAFYFNKSEDGGYGDYSDVNMEEDGTIDNQNPSDESVDKNIPAAPVAPNPKPVAPSPVPTSIAPGEEPPASYTLAQVATHADSKSCWSAINGGVYDLTSWINNHPGGKFAILSICGKDGSDSFNGKHGGQARPMSELVNFKIGTLKQ